MARTLKTFLGLVIYLSWGSAAFAHPQFPQNHRGRVNITCGSRAPQVQWIQFAFDPTGAGGTQLNLVGEPSLDGIVGSVLSRWLPYLEGTNQGVVQAWGTVGSNPIHLAAWLKREAPMTSALESRLTVETYRGAREISLSCCLGRMAPAVEGDVTCQPLDAVVIAAIRLTTSDGTLTNQEKTARIQRLMSLQNIY